MTGLGRFDGYGVLVTGGARGIGAAVAFLASRDAAWTTGTALRGDGGPTAVHSGFHAALRPHREARRGSESR